MTASSTSARPTSKAPRCWLDSSGDLTASPGLTLKTEDLALGAGQVAFTQDETSGSGLVITPELQALISQIHQVTIRTPRSIVFSSGTYAFDNLTLDTPGLALADGAAVTIGCRHAHAGQQRRRIRRLRHQRTARLRQRARSPSTRPRSTSPRARCAPTASAAARR